MDESGDAGFKFNKGSSRYYVLTLLVVHETESLVALFDECKRAIGLQPHNELKFTNTRRIWCERIMRVLNRTSTTSLTVIWDKTMMVPVADAQTFQKACLVEALRLLHPTPTAAVLIIDESAKSRAWQREVATHIRKQLNSPHQRVINTTRFQSSARTALLQMTDLICGALAADARQGTSYFRAILDSNRHTVVFRKSDA